MLFKSTCFVAFFSILFFIPFTGKAQYSQPLNNYVLEVWSAEEGLPSNNLRHITKDSYGFMWISTFNGLVRFDGVKFTNYDSQNVDSLQSSAFYSTYLASNGKLYISTQSSGIFVLDQGQFHPFKLNNELPKSIQTTFYDDNGIMWIGTRNAGVFTYKDGIVKKINIPEFKNSSISSFTQDSLKNIWIASEGAGVAKVSPTMIVEKIFTTEDGLLSNIANSVYYHDGIIYLGTESGLSFTPNGTQWHSDTRLMHMSINQVISDGNSNLWFATDEGLGRILQNNTFEFVSEPYGLPSRQVSSVAFDNEKNIWITTKRGGLAQLKLSNFKNLTPKDGLSYRGVNIVAASKKGSIYIGSDNGDVDVYESGNIRKFSIHKNLTNVSVKDIMVDAKGAVWLATYEGVIKKEGTKETYYTVNDGLLSDKTRRLLEDKNGIIWVGSRNGGLNKIYKDGSIKSISVANGLGSDFVFSVDQAPDGRIVVGTANGGLDIIDNSGDIHIYKPEGSITGLSIFNVYIENDHRFWLATNIGLYCFENNKFFLINPSKGLPVETIFDIKEDAEGGLWMSSILGLIKVKKEDLLSCISGKSNKINALLLDDSDGMVSRECTGATKMLISKEGVIYVPTIGGVAYINPSDFFVNTKAPEVYIEEVVVDDGQLSLGNCCGKNAELTIEPGHRNYKIAFTSLSMYSPKKIKFKYKLEGFDKNWVPNGNLREAKYTNLPYGTYVFKVMAANNNGVWSKQPATITITIKPFFYKTKWFIVVLILVFVVFTYALYVYQTKEVNTRNKELEKLNAELDTFAYSVSHDLKAPLASIQGLLNIARLEKGEHALDYYNKIEKSVDKLDDFIVDIIDYSKNSRLELSLENVNIKAIINEILQGLNYLTDEQSIRFEVAIADDLSVDLDKTRFNFVANNLITNAYRYADFEKEAPYVKIAAYIEKNNFIFSVEDNGQGIKDDMQGKVYDMFVRANEGSSGSGLGLYIVKESLDKMKGSISMNSTYKIGTTFVVKIPINLKN